MTQFGRLLQGSRVSGVNLVAAAPVALGCGTRPGPWLRCPSSKVDGQQADASRRQNGPRKVAGSNLGS